MQCRRLVFNPWVRKIPWRRKWQPIPAFLPGKSQGQRSLESYSPWDRKKFRQALETKNNCNNCIRTILTLRTFLCYFLVSNHITESLLMSVINMNMFSLLSRQFLYDLTSTYFIWNNTSYKKTACGSLQILKWSFSIVLSI